MGGSAAGGDRVVRVAHVGGAVGTSGVVFAHSDEVQYDPEGRLHTFCHAVRGKWHVMGCVLSAGGSLQWYRNELGQAEMADAKRKKVDPYELMTAQAATLDPLAVGFY